MLVVGKLAGFEGEVCWAEAEPVRKRSRKESTLAARSRVTLAALAATAKLLLNVSKTSMAPLMVLRAVEVGGQTGLAKMKPTILRAAFHCR